ncbi:MAG: hypothetical protein HYX41_04460, partial [Bdellovibrio sp.]|nr:hypothetical protein [Bdellovibrio sp.]
FVFTSGSSDLTSGDLYLYTGSSKNIILQAGGGTTGNVGIGTSAPTERLNVYGGNLLVDGPWPGSGTHSREMTVKSGQGTLYQRSWSVNGGGDYGEISFSDYFSGADHFKTLALNPQGGRVGIGTNAPTTKLSINDVVGNGGEADSSTALTMGYGGRYGIGFNTASYGFLNIFGHQSSNSINIGFDTGSYGTFSPKLTVTSGGMVGIGTNTPNSRLAVQTSGGSISIAGLTSWDGRFATIGYANGAASPGIGIGYDAPSGVNYILSLEPGVAWKPLTINAGNIALNPSGTGSVGIGTTSPVSALHVVGIVTASGFNGPFSGTSGSFSSGITVSSGGANLTGGINNNNGGITNAGDIGASSLSVSNANSKISLGTTDAASGAWLRNDGSNTVLSTNVGDLYLGYGGNTGKTIRIGNGGGAVQITGSAPEGSLFMDSSGRVGLGTSSPNARLSIDQGATNNVALTLSSSGPGWGSGMSFVNSGASGRSYGVYSGSDGYFHVADNYAALDRLRIAPDGSTVVGVSGNGALAIGNINTGLSSGQSVGLQFLNLGTQHAGLRWANDGTSNLYVENASASFAADSWYSAALPLNLIVRNGSLGVGTTAPAAKVDVVGGGGINLGLRVSAGNGSGYGYMQFGQDTTLSNNYHMGS